MWPRRRKSFRCCASLRGRRTIVLIAHQPSLLQSCDEVFQLDRGRLVASNNDESQFAATDWMKVALIVPGGVDPSGEVRVIPALIALLGRLTAAHEVHVFATHQDARPGSWILEGARVHNLGLPRTAWRAAAAILREHHGRPFQVVHAFWSGRHGALAVAMGALLGVPSVVHVAGGELAALHDIGYGGCRSWRGRARERIVLRAATVVTCASGPIANQVAERGVSAQTVSLGVDLGRWPASSAAGAAARPTRCGSCTSRA